MTPLGKTAVRAGGTLHVSPFVGPVDHTEQVKIDVSTLDVQEVDADGYLKPGVPIQLPGGVGTGPVAGALPTNADQRAGITIEPIKIAADNAAATLAAAPDVQVAVAYLCAINRARCEDILGRAFSAADLGALANGNVRVIE